MCDDASTFPGFCIAVCIGLVLDKSVKKSPGLEWPGLLVFAYLLFLLLAVGGCLQVEVAVRCLLVVLAGSHPRVFAFRLEE